MKRTVANHWKSSVRWLAIAGILLAASAAVAATVVVSLATWTTRNVSVSLAGGGFAYTNAYQAHYVTGIQFAGCRINGTNTTATGALWRTTASWAGATNLYVGAIAITGTAAADQGYGETTNAFWIFYGDVLTATGAGASNGLGIISGPSSN